MVKPSKEVSCVVILLLAVILAKCTTERQTDTIEAMNKTPIDEIPNEIKEVISKIGKNEKL